MPPGAAQTKIPVPCKHYRKGNCRYGSRCKFLHDLDPNQASSPINPHDNTNLVQESNIALPGALSYVSSASENWSTVPFDQHVSVSSSSSVQARSTPNNQSAIKALLGVNISSQTWQAESFTLGNQNHFLHEIQTRNTREVFNGQRSSQGSNVIANTIIGKEASVRRIREQVEVARLAREQAEAVRKMQDALHQARELEEEAVQRARQIENARLAKEHAAAVLRERVVQLAREREEAEERERQAQLAEEAAQRAHQERTRLAREYAAAARREWLAQMAKEREEAIERERQAQREAEAAQKAREENLRLARERAAAARRGRLAQMTKEREEAMERERQAQREAEAARKERQESARLAKERAAAARRERLAQLAKEREEEGERQRELQRRKQEEDWVKESAVTIQQIVSSSFVWFEAGLTVQHMICGFEASQILVKNLPFDANHSEIIELFTQQGVEEEDLAILRTEVVDGLKQVTVLGKAEDVETIALGLHGIEFRDRNLELIIRERSSEGHATGFSNHNSYHLNISWRPAFLTMLAHYPHLDTSDLSQKIQELDQQRINGLPVRAELHVEPRALRFGNFGDRDPPHRQDGVKISGIPNATTIEMVRTFAGTESVEHYDDSSSYSTDGVFTAVENHLRSLDGSTLRTITLESTPRANSISAKAIFSSWEGALSARDSLDGRLLGPNFPSLLLFLPEPYRFVIALDEKQYNSQRSQWTELIKGNCNEATIRVKFINKAVGKRVVITLFGRDKKAVGALKVRIENMAAGQKLDATYWHPSFKFGQGFGFLKDLYEVTGAYVRCDRKHDCIAVFGHTEAVERAKSRIKEEVDRLSSEESTIPLQRRALGFFIREGLAEMRALLGEENVTLDVGSAKIKLRGADLEEARHYLQQLLVNFQHRNLSLALALDETLCPICYDSVSQPIELGCRHIYCSPCLRHYVFSTLDNHNFPLKCMGSDATCNKPLSLPLIKRFLPPHRFELLLEAALASYLDKNPETFKYCNTPDCSQVYRATTQPRDLQCPSCFSEVCTACHDEGHAGMTCVEKRQHKNPEEQERLLEEWATGNNVKRCPSCRAWVEKIEGCNHITCKCGIHYCWICSEVFDGNRIYEHMTQVHGNWYEDPGRDRVQADAGQPLEQVVDIVEIAGGPEAVAEQAAELRRLEQLRLDLAAVADGWE